MSHREDDSRTAQESFQPQHTTFGKIRLSKISSREAFKHIKPEDRTQLGAQDQPAMSEPAVRPLATTRTPLCNPPSPLSVSSLAPSPTPSVSAGSCRSAALATRSTSLPTRTSLLGLPYEPREQIFSYVFQRQEGPIIIKGHEYFLRNHSRKGCRCAGERPRAYLLPNSNEGDYVLFSNHPLAQVNRQLRQEISDFLHTAPVDVITQVEKLDYTHIIAFLETLPVTRLKDFTVQPDLDPDSTRTLHISLSATCNSESRTKPLSTWLSAITHLLQDDEEFSIATSLASQPATQRPSLKSLLELYDLWISSRVEGGPAREELRKIVVVFWTRIRREGLAVTGVDVRDTRGKMGCVPFERGFEGFLGWLWLGP